MTKASKYLRDRIKDEIFNMVHSVNNNLEIRGSWKMGDFHYNKSNNTTYSDLDLFLPHHNNINIDSIRIILASNIRSLLNIEVKIQTNNDIYNINLEDSYIKVIYEFIISITNASFQHDPYFIQYSKAKSFILLNRNSNFISSYSDIVADLKQPCFYDLLKVKMGIKQDYETTQLHKFMDTCSNELIVDFYKNCMIGNPPINYIAKMRDSFQSVSSITDSLKYYINQKAKNCYWYGN